MPFSNRTCHLDSPSLFLLLPKPCGVVPGKVSSFLRQSLPPQEIQLFIQQMFTKHLLCARCRGSSWGLHSEQDQATESLPSGCFPLSGRKTRLIDVIIVSKLCNAFEGATSYWGEIEQGAGEGRAGSGPGFEGVTQAEHRGESHVGIEGRAVRAEGTAPGWNMPGNSRETSVGGGAQEQVTEDKASGKTGM